jgi:hypothetical protein
MKMLKITAILLFSASALISVNARAIDTSGAAQLEASPPSAEGALTADQIPPITQKPATTINNNPQGGAQPATGIMTPTGGNAQGTPAAPTSLPMNPVRASPTTGNATNPAPAGKATNPATTGNPSNPAATTGNAQPPAPAAVNPNLPRQ